MNTIAEALGLSVKRDGLAPCPVCGAKTRHTKTQDRRAAVGVRPDQQGWHCFQCDVSGDGLTLAAYVLTGERRPSEEVRRRLADLGLIAGENGAHIRPRNDVDPVARGKGAAEPESRNKGSSCAPDGAIQWRPTSEAIDRWWRTLEPVTAWPQALAELGGRPRPGINVDRAAALDLVRLMPASGPVPEWAERWQRKGLRVVVRCYDAAGRAAGVRFRDPAAKMERPPWLPGRSYAARGAVMADGLAVSWLQGDPVAIEAVKESGLVLVEGCPAWLAWATTFAVDARAPATVGVYSGGWSRAMASKVPPGARVTLDLDDDGGGMSLYRSILPTLTGRRVTVCLTERFDAYLRGTHDNAR